LKTAQLAFTKIALLAEIQIVSLTRFHCETILMILVKAVLFWILLLYGFYNLPSVKFAKKNSQNPAINNVLLPSVNFAKKFTEPCCK
jgi:hypothetical protein